MNCVQAAITDYSQVIELDADGIQGELASLCATLNITPDTLRQAAQEIRKAMVTGSNKVDAYAAGIRYAKNHQEPRCIISMPTDEQVAAYNALQAALWAKRRGEVA
jgi:hypothetical protein